MNATGPGCQPCTKSDSQARLRHARDGSDSHLFLHLYTILEVGQSAVKGIGINAGYTFVARKSSAPVRRGE